MTPPERPLLESPSLGDFARATRPRPLTRKGTIDVQGKNVGNGLAALVLTLVKLLHELLEKEAIRRMEGGSLSEEQIDELGTTLMRQAEEIDRMRRMFGLEEEDLNLDLGPLGRLL